MLVVVSTSKSSGGMKPGGIHAAETSGFTRRLALLHRDTSPFIRIVRATAYQGPHNRHRLNRTLLDSVHST
jgi:hypothetical protein